MFVTLRLSKNWVEERSQKSNPFELSILFIKSTWVAFYNEQIGIFSCPFLLIHEKMGFSFQRKQKTCPERASELPEMLAIENSGDKHEKNICTLWTASATQAAGSRVLYAQTVVVCSKLLERSTCPSKGHPTIIVTSTNACWPSLLLRHTLCCNGFLPAQATRMMLLPLPEQHPWSLGGGRLQNLSSSQNKVS